MELEWYDNIELTKTSLSEDLHTLHFTGDFNQEIKENVLPKNLHTVYLGCLFNKNIKLPTSVKYISLFSHNNLVNNLPYHVETVFIKFKDLTHDVINLPYTIKKIIIYKKEYTKYIKIPFDCILEIFYKWHN